MSASHIHPQEPEEMLKKIEEYKVALTRRSKLIYNISHDDLDKIKRCTVALSALQRNILNKNNVFSADEKITFNEMYSQLAIEASDILKSVEVSKSIASDHRSYKKDINRIAFRGSSFSPEIVFEKGFSRDANDQNVQLRVQDVFISTNVHAFSKNIDAAAFFPVPIKDNNEKKCSNSESYIYVVNLKTGFDVHAHGFLTMDQATLKEPQRFLFAEEICSDEVEPDDIIAAIKISRDFSNFNVNQGSNESKEDEYPSNEGGKYEITGIQYNPKALDKLKKDNAERVMEMMTRLVGTERNIAGDKSGYTQVENKKTITPRR